MPSFGELWVAFMVMIGLTMVTTSLLVIAIVYIVAPFIQQHILIH